MRGKVSIKAKKAVMMRITPAYAGKSRGNCFTDRFEGDHPRLCGEKFGTGAAHTVLSGSPPPMRGKVPAPVAEGIEHGITPAYAGKSGS